MLVICSDIHLNDGTVCTSTDANSANLFFTELQDQILAAGQRQDGSYVPVNEIDVILLGDIFDFIRSERWLDAKTRPWDSVEAYAPVVEKICDEIIKENRDFLAHFQNASKNGIPVMHPTGEGVCKVNFHYMVGNHDWFPLVDSPLMEQVREKLRLAFGLTQDKFPWRIDENNPAAQAVLKTCLDHRVYVQHGDQYDEFNYHQFLGREKSSLGDAIVIELITKFPVEVVKEIKRKFPDDVLSDEFLKALEELDNVRPSTHSVIFLRNIIEKLTPKKHKKIVRKVFLDCSRSVQKSNIFKTVGLRDWKPTTKLLAMNLASQWSPTCVVRAVTSVVDLLKTEHEKMAAKEPFVRSGKCDFVVYGHTHDHVVKGIGARKDENKTLVPKIYINSATWRPVNIEITTGDRIDGFPYFSQKTMTWVTFFRDGERKGRPYETWSGRLGLKNPQ